MMAACCRGVGITIIVLVAAASGSYAAGPSASLVQEALRFSSRCAVYDPDQPQHVLILGPERSRHAWNDSLPASWAPESVEQTSLLVFVDEEMEWKLDSEKYVPTLGPALVGAAIGPEVEITRFQRYCYVSIYPAKDCDFSEPLARSRVFGLRPQVLGAQESGTRKMGGPPLPELLWAWLTDYVDPTAGKALGRLPPSDSLRTNDMVTAAWWVGENRALLIGHGDANGFWELDQAQCVQELPQLRLFGPGAFLPKSNRLFAGRPDSDVAKAYRGVDVDLDTGAWAMFMAGQALTTRKLAAAPNELVMAISRPGGDPFGGDRGRLKTIELYDLKRSEQTRSLLGPPRSQVSGVLC